MSFSGHYPSPTLEVSTLQSQDGREASRSSLPFTDSSQLRNDPVLQTASLPAKKSVSIGGTINVSNKVSGSRMNSLSRPPRPPSSHRASSLGPLTSHSSNEHSNSEIPQHSQPSPTSISSAASKRAVNKPPKLVTIMNGQSHLDSPIHEECIELNLGSNVPSKYLDTPTLPSASSNDHSKHYQHPEVLFSEKQSLFDSKLESFKKEHSEHSLHEQHKKSQSRPRNASNLSLLDTSQSSQDRHAEQIPSHIELHESATMSDTQTEATRSRSVSRGRRAERSVEPPTKHHKKSAKKHSKSILPMHVVVESNQESVQSMPKANGEISDMTHVNHQSESILVSSKKHLKKKHKSPVRQNAPDLFDHVNRKSHDFEGCIMTIHIAQTDALVSEKNLRHPLVQIHIIDEVSGQYVLKSDPSRAVTTFNEPATLDFILPVITKPFELFKNNTKTPKWDETIMLNEEYLHLVRPGQMILFEVLDMLSDFKHAKSGTDGWYRIAWGFLKLVGGLGQTNTEKQVRLQLFKYPWWLKQGRTINRIPFIYHIWRRKDRRKYPSTLFVQVSAHGRVEPREVTRRPIGPTEKETGRLTYEQLLRTYSIKKRPMENAMRSLLNLHTEHTWRRKEGHQCKIPNKLKYRINGGDMGAFACSFSHNGMLLAVACSNRQTYPIRLYDVLTGERVESFEGHQDLVYQLIWTLDDTELISASADGSVRVWRFFSDGSACMVATYQHPTFVYTATIRPPISDESTNKQQMLVTGAYDGIIRFWSHDSKALSQSKDALQPYPTSALLFHKPIHKLVGHACNINAVVFDAQGHRLFSADAQGTLKIWSSRSLLLSQPAASLSVSNAKLDYDCIKSIQVGPNPIHSLIMHPGGRSLIVQTGVSIHTLDVRIFRFLTHINIPGAGESLSKRIASISPTRIDAKHSIPNLSSMTASAKVEYNLLSKNDTPIPGQRSMVVSHISPAHLPSTRFGGLFTRACVSPCGSWIICGAPTNGLVYVWRVETGAMVASYDPHHVHEWDDTNDSYGFDFPAGDDNFHRNTENRKTSDSDVSDNESRKHTLNRHKKQSQFQTTGISSMSPKQLGAATVVHIAFHPKDHYACFVRWGQSQPVRLWEWNEHTPEMGLGKYNMTTEEQTKLQETAVGVGYLNVDAIVHKSLASRMNLADSIDNMLSFKRDIATGQNKSPHCFAKSTTQQVYGLGPLNLKKSVQLAKKDREAVID
ncbi:Jouberin [Batrachochytrium dendrobatidis]|nr:Jouberin [Batrachochytrium dendrobatidis]KAK5666698.1 Jouberin [Batrachochytrium dendrobatidis]